MKSLTPAEHRALVTLARLGTAKQAAHELGKSVHTVERQVESARVKLNVSTTIQAYRMVRDDIGK